MIHRSAEEIQRDNISLMGEELGMAYSALWQELALLYQKWENYVELFGTNPGRIDVLNRAASSTIRVIQDALWESILLHIARLTDPPHAHRKPDQANLSIRHLTALLQETPLRDDIQTKQTETLDACKFARNWRDKSIAHRDISVALKKNAEPLAHASRLTVKLALQSLENYLNSVSTHYLQSTTGFEYGHQGDDAVALLYVIRDGLRHQDAERERIRNRDYANLRHGPDPI